MGQRDNLIVNEPSDEQVLVRLLATLEPTHDQDPPSDLVERALHRLPSLPPSSLAQHDKHVRQLRWALTGVITTIVILLLALGLVELIGGSDLALLVGDGQSGLSYYLLMAGLILRPLLRTVDLLNGSILLLICVLAIVGGWLWWRLMRLPSDDQAAEVV